MAFKEFYILNSADLFSKGGILNIFILFITLFFLCKICIPNGVPILVMFFVLRDNVGKFLMNDLKNGSFELFLLTEGTIYNFLWKKVCSFLLTYGFCIIFFPFCMHCFIYNYLTININSISMIISYILLFIVFLLTISLCSALTILQKNSHIMTNLLYLPFVLPIMMLFVSYLEKTTSLQVVLLSGTAMILVNLVLLQYSLLNFLTE